MTNQKKYQCETCDDVFWTLEDSQLHSCSKLVQNSPRRLDYNGDPMDSDVEPMSTSSDHSFVELCVPEERNFEFLEDYEEEKKYGAWDPEMMMVEDEDVEKVDRATEHDWILEPEPSIQEVSSMSSEDPTQSWETSEVSADLDGIHIDQVETSSGSMEQDEADGRIMGDCDNGQDWPKVEEDIVDEIEAHKVLREIFNDFDKPSKKSDIQEKSGEKSIEVLDAFDENEDAMTAEDPRTPEVVEIDEDVTNPIEVLDSHDDDDDEQLDDPKIAETVVADVEKPVDPEQKALEELENELQRLQEINSPLFHFYNNLWNSRQLKMEEFSNSERLKILHIIKNHYRSFDFQKPQFLLMENDIKSPEEKQTQCFMNTLINLLYSCEDFRRMVHSFAVEGTMSILTSIFLGVFNSGRLWRYTLPKHYHSGEQDVITVFDLLMGRLRELQVPIQMLQSVSYTEIRCEECSAVKEIKKHSDDSSTLSILNREFYRSLEATYSPKKHSKTCDCGGALWKTRKVKPQGRNHVMKLEYRNCKTFSDLDWESQVFMFEAKWRIRAVAQRIEATNDYDAHFVAYIRGEGPNENWFYLVNDNAAHFSQTKLSEIEVKMIVFERI